GTTSSAASDVYKRQRSHHALTTLSPRSHVGQGPPGSLGILSGSFEVSFLKIRVGIGFKAVFMHKKRVSLRKPFSIYG
ncbi:hypothetical protein ACS126_18850, partial [Sphingobacterium lactis]|uniref:hypothetical protein n=1 Tax=Sphingobacterium lactis TaxID=797291 RepID=UPI003EC7F212